MTIVYIIGLYMIDKLYIFWHTDRYSHEYRTEITKKLH